MNTAIIYQEQMNEENLGQAVELHISCTALKNLDTFSKSDAQVRVYIKDVKQTDWKFVGATEVMENNLNPKFAKAIEVFYKFEVN